MRLAICALGAALIATPAFADNATDINALIRTGQYPDALIKVDAGLVQTPRDKQLRFLKGVILTEQNKPNEAIAVFTKLTEDFPDLPEPYNNLAVLFAGSGQYDKARAALEMAIRTNPTYATAHENLGDVYAKLASQAYDKALQLDSGNATAKSKLTMIRSLVGTSAETRPAAATSNTKPAAIQVATNSKPVATVAAKPEPKFETIKVEPKPMPDLKPKVEAKAIPKVEPKPEEKAVAKPMPMPLPTPTDAERDDVLNAVNSWAKAWSAKDVNGYLGYYTADFQPGSNQPHKAWAEDRRARIEGKGSINVKIDGPKVSIDGNTATVKFRQQYSSDHLHSNGPKTLVLTKHAGKWLIKQEHAGS